MSTIPDGWLPMSSALKDGTIILVCELPPTDCGPIVWAAAWMNWVGNGPNWIGVAGTSRLPLHLLDRQDAAAAVGLPVGWREYHITPLCWKPLPLAEEEGKLRRRQAQILSVKYGKRKKQ